MISRMSSGSMWADRAVEPTRSENITVTWRRSARSSGETLGAVGVVAASAEEALPPLSAQSAATASSSLSRCPTAVTPSSFRVSCVRLGRTVSSISFSRNAASYFPRPRLRSQPPISIDGALTPSDAHDRLNGVSRAPLLWPFRVKLTRRQTTTRESEPRHRSYLDTA